MKVKELISLLKKYDQNAVVMYGNEDADMIYSDYEDDLEGHQNLITGYITDADNPSRAVAELEGVKDRKKIVVLRG